MIISFNHLIRECIYHPKKKFHNRLSQEKLRKIFSLFHKKFQEWSNKSFSKIESGGKRVCRKLTDGEKWERVEDFYELKNCSTIKELMLSSELWQFRISEEIRVIGILEEDYVNELSLPKKDRASNKDLFSVLYYDFEHSSHPRKKVRDLICIMKEEDCLSH